MSVGKWLAWAATLGSSKTLVPSSPSLPSREAARKAGQWLMIGALLVAGSSGAAIISLPHDFVDGTAALAGEVNANFSVLVGESNNQDGRLTTLEATSITQTGLDAHSADTAAHHTKTSLFTALSDQIADAQIPTGLTRDAEVLGLVLSADGAGSSLDADELDGLSSSSFLRSNASNQYTAGVMTFNPGTTVNLNGVVSIGANSGNDSDLLFFDSGSESLTWNEVETRFEFSEALALDGLIVAGHLDGSYFYHRFASASTSGVPASGLMNTESDVYVADDIEAGDDIWAGGDVNVDRVVIRGGADLSEGFSISAAAQAIVEPGMVLCIDTEQAGALEVCQREYDRTVAGIVSGAGGVSPGMIMSQQGSIAAGEYPVALTGRVYVKAHAGVEPILPGDLLTTATLTGHAQRVTDHARSQGAIIGKAMTGLNTGSGLILMLVALQ